MAMTRTETEPTIVLTDPQPKRARRPSLREDALRMLRDLANSEADEAI
jgi:hypothetical protein